MNELYASIKQRMTKPGLDLATNRDIVENLHLAATEPEAVTYAEVDAGGVPALWCIPQGSDQDRVLLHSHSGGSVVTSMHTDRKAIGHIAKAVGVRSLVDSLPAGPTGFHPWIDIVVRLGKLPAVTISAIRGRARGAGSELVLASDIRFASIALILTRHR